MKEATSTVELIEHPCEMTLTVRVHVAADNRQNGWVLAGWWELCDARNLREATKLTHTWKHAIRRQWLRARELGANAVRLELGRTCVLKFATSEAQDLLLDLITIRQEKARTPGVQLRPQKTRYFKDKTKHGK
jgi:hypothetical protein